VIDGNPDFVLLHELVDRTPSGPSAPLDKVMLRLACTKMRPSSEVTELTSSTAAAIAS
jgi:hypothetical protein